MATDMTIANTIRSQLGNKFVVMVRARNFVGDESSLSFQIGSGAAKGINFVKIAYDAALDLYDVTYYKVGRSAFKIIEQAVGVYADSLHEHFTQTTGFDTSL